MPAAPLILVVDDDAATREMLQDVLETEGYRVDGVDNPADALRRILSDSVALVLLDMRLAGEDGLELCRQVRAQERHHRARIVVVSAWDADQTAAAAQAAGADDYLAKPIDLDDLLVRVQLHTGAPEAIGDSSVSLA